MYVKKGDLRILPHLTFKKLIKNQMIGCHQSPRFLISKQKRIFFLLYIEPLSIKK